MMTVNRNGSVSHDSVPLWKDSVFSSPLNGREKCIAICKLKIVRLLEKDCIFELL